MAVRKGQIKGPAMPLDLSPTPSLPSPPRSRDQGQHVAEAAGADAATAGDGLTGDIIAASPDPAAGQPMEHQADPAGTAAAAAARAEGTELDEEPPHFSRGRASGQNEGYDVFDQRQVHQQDQRRASGQRASLPGQQEGHGGADGHRTSLPGPLEGHAGAAPDTPGDELQQAVPPDAEGMTMRLLLEEKPDAGGWPAGGGGTTGWGMGSMGTGRGSVGSNLMTVNLVGRVILAVLDGASGR